MNRRYIFKPVAFVVIFVLSSTLLCAAADQSSRKISFKLDRAPKYLVPESRFSESVIQDNLASNPIRLNQSNSTSSPGTIIGLTAYDYQHNGAMGRQIAFSSIDNIVHMVWTYQSLPVMPGDRRVAYQYYDPPTYGPDTFIATESQYTGYVTNDVLPDGMPVFICNYLEADQFHSAYYFGNPSPPPPFLYEVVDYGMESIWPIIEVHCGDSQRVTEDVVYALTHDLSASEDVMLYRKVGGGSWGPGIFIETCTNLSYVIVADPNSDSVAIVYTDDRSGLAEGEGSQTDLDIYYKLSTDQGISWGDAVNVSNYTLDSLWRAYADLSALFTSDGVLHIIWSARKLINTQTYENSKCRLVHWSADYQHTSVIEVADYDMTWNDAECDPGAWNMYIAKMSLTQCDNRLYALYTKFGDADEPGALNDCSDDNFANGELYLAASDNWGLSWGPAENLTQTRTPGCDSAECESDHWATMVRYGMIYGDESVADTMDIIYINDKDAGGISQGEGTWCANNVMHYRFPCRDVDHVGRIALEPESYLESTPPGEELYVNLKIENVGNGPVHIQDIYVDYVNGTGWISIGSYSSPIGVGGFETVNITLNAGGILSTPSSVWRANIIVDTDAPSDADTVPVTLYIESGPQQYCESISTTTKNLMVCNTGRLGNGADGASLDIPGDCDADLAFPNGDMYLYDASPMISWNDGTQNLAHTCIFTQYPDQGGTFNPLSDFWTVSESDYNQIFCTLATTDDLFGINVTLWGPTSGPDFVIAKYEFYALSAAKGLDEVYIGFIADWDVPSDNMVDNTSSYGSLYHFILQGGVESNTADEDPPHSCDIYEDARIAGTAVLSEAPLNGWTAVNNTLQYGSGLHPDSLYTRMSTLTGYNLYPGEPSDLHTAFTVKRVDMTNKSSHSFVIALATTNSGEDMQNRFRQAYNWAVTHDIMDNYCFCGPGDANGDGNHMSVGDAVYLISYVFKEGPAPTPYEICNGDANGDCNCDVGDVVYIITYVFKGGPPPPTCMEWVSVCGPYE